ncbi:site-specific integrase [Rothia sp. AR01]|uniref:Site-specific integrase n=1 Tax=Rothia santali TaxID=2949643 RepID=A0A9X2HE23_9MICC|nr:site-specific integrase [Rothia santali]MCP3425997.1 site-specific integrase [Rothia santali]
MPRPPARTRRSNGEGTKPRQRKDGRWQIDLRISQTTTGQSIRKSFIARTRADVVAKAQTYRNQLDRGVLADPAKTTLTAWLEHWLADIAKPRLRERTWLSYRGYLRKWVITQPAGTVPLEKLAPTDIDRIHTAMRAPRDGRPGCSETTVNLVHRILSKALSDAEKRGMIGANPAKKASVPRPATFEPVVLTPAQARELVGAAEHDDVWGPSWIVALALGLRQGERLGLCWDDVDLAAGTLRIRRELGPLPWQHGCGGTPARPACGRPRGNLCPARHGGGPHLFPTKSDAGNRSLALPAPILRALQRQQRNQRLWREQEGEAWVGFTDSAGAAWDLVFSQRNGRPIGHHQDRKAWHAFTAEHGIEGMRVHDARHTAATVLLSLGVAPRVVMGMMGWSQTAMLTRYQHVLDEMRVDAATRVAGALWGPAEGPGEGPASGAAEGADGSTALGAPEAATGTLYAGPAESPAIPAASETRRGRGDLPAVQEQASTQRSPAAVPSPTVVDMTAFRRRKRG